jgi:hypothetical protein
MSSPTALIVSRDDSPVWVVMVGAEEDAAVPRVEGTPAAAVSSIGRAKGGAGQEASVR